MNEVTGLVLAGGEGKRLGRDKAAVCLGGRTLLEWAVRALNGLCAEVIVVGRTAGPTATLNVRWVPDLTPHLGPLGGLYTGLDAARGRYCLCIGCDTPFLQGRLLAYLLRLVPGCDAVVPWVAGAPEPLVAVYARSCLGAIEKLLDRDQLKLTDLYQEVRTRFVSIDEIEPLDPEGLSFLNINTPADLARAEQAVRERFQT
ncbi:MAG: molybdenum cofactor guanylyltransferase [Chloroflexi bacterium]|nr:molybdenum cofactor guanylyltransferase [Chloroflexota bacterium]